MVCKSDNSVTKKVAFDPLFEYWGEISLNAGQAMWCLHPPTSPLFLLWKYAANAFLYHTYLRTCAVLLFLFLTLTVNSVNWLVLSRMPVWLLSVALARQCVLICILSVDCKNLVENEARPNKSLISYSVKEGERVWVSVWVCIRKRAGCVCGGGTRRKVEAGIHVKAATPINIFIWRLCTANPLWIVAANVVIKIY